MSKVLQRNLQIPDAQREYLIDSSRKEVLDCIKAFSARPDLELLIIYFSGHGIVSDDRKNYYLALKATDINDLQDTSLGIDRLTQVIGDKLKVLFIIDACFSEKIFDIFNARDYFIIASSARNKTSKYPPNEDYSVFTGKLKNVIENGIDINKPFLTAEDIFENLTEQLRLEGSPIPHRSAKNEVGHIHLFKNRFKASGTPNGYMIDLLFGAVTKNATPDILEEIRHTDFSNTHYASNLKQRIVLDNYPTFIAPYIRKLLFNETILNEICLQFYSRIIRFIGLIAIVELVRSGELRRMVAKPVSCVRNLLHEHLVLLLNKSLDARETWFIDELRTNLAKIVPIINEIEKHSGEPTGKQIQPLLIKLIAELSCLINYDFLSVRLITVKKRYLKPDEFIHTFSELKGTEISGYKFSLRFEDNYLNSSSILVFKASTHRKIVKNAEYMNLWPFILDANALDSSADYPDLYYFTGASATGDYQYDHALKDEARKWLYQYVSDLWEIQRQQENITAFERNFQ